MLYSASQRKKKQKKRAVLDKNIVTPACVLVIDICKAFDTVNRKILSSKLEYYGVCSIPLTWFKIYIKNKF